MLKFWPKILVRLPLNFFFSIVKKSKNMNSRALNHIISALFKFFLLSKHHHHTWCLSVKIKQPAKELSFKPYYLWALGVYELTRFKFLLFMKSKCCYYFFIIYCACLCLAMLMPWIKLSSNPVFAPKNSACIVICMCVKIYVCDVV